MNTPVCLNIAKSHIQPKGPETNNKKSRFSQKNQKKIKNKIKSRFGQKNQNFFYIQLKIRPVHGNGDTEHSSVLKHSSKSHSAKATRNKLTFGKKDQ